MQPFGVAPTELGQWEIHFAIDISRLTALAMRRLARPGFSTEPLSVCAPRPESFRGWTGRDLKHRRQRRTSPLAHRARPHVPDSALVKVLKRNESGVKPPHSKALRAKSH